jgi:hypothetical protein
MEFHLLFPETELAEISFLADQGEVEFLVSKSSDPFQEVINALLNFEADEDAELSDDSYMFLWTGDTWGYEWQFEKMGEGVVQLKIIQINNLRYYLSRQGIDDDVLMEEIVPVNEDEILYEETIIIDELISAVVRCVDRYLKEYGILDYSRQWGNTGFAITSYLKLKSYLLQKDLWTGDAAISEVFKRKVGQLIV